MDQKAELRKAYTLTAIIGGAIMASVIAYTVIVEAIKRQPEGSGFPLAPDTISLIRFVFLGVAIAVLVAIPVLKKALLSPEAQIPQAAFPEGFRPEIQRLFITSIVIFALCEIAAVFGLVLFWLGRRATDFYLFLIISLVYFAVFFPRYSAWEEWMQERERMTRRQG